MSQALVAVALLASLFAAVSSVVGRGGGSDGMERPSRPQGDAAGRLRDEHNGGYARWAVPAVDSSLMVPALGRDGHVWAPALEGGSLVLAHPSARAASVMPLPERGHPHTAGAAVDRQNAVWLAQDGTHSIARFDPERRTYEIFETPTPRSSPFGIAIDGGGRVWFTEMAARRIGVFDPADRRFAEYPLPGEVGNPYWLAIGGDGRVWFTTIGTPFIGVVEPDSGAITLHRIPDLPDFEGTTGIDVAPDGDVWFAVRTGTLGRFDPVTGRFDLRGLPTDMAYGVAVAGDGRVWVATTHDAVYALDPASGELCCVRTGKGAWWVTAAEDGAIWVAESARHANALGRISPERAAVPCAG